MQFLDKLSFGCVFVSETDKTWATLGIDVVDCEGCGEGTAEDQGEI
jgi:hypothetical protein